MLERTVAQVALSLEVSCAPTNYNATKKPQGGPLLKCDLQTNCCQKGEHLCVWMQHKNAIDQHTNHNKKWYTTYSVKCNTTFNGEEAAWELIRAKTAD